MLPLTAQHMPLSTEYISGATHTFKHHSNIALPKHLHQKSHAQLVRKSPSLHAASWRLLAMADDDGFVGATLEGERVRNDRRELKSAGFFLARPPLRCFLIAILTCALDQY